jgi:hypothetical protein
MFQFVISGNFIFQQSGNLKVNYPSKEIPNILLGYIFPIAGIQTFRTSEK